MKSTTSRPGRKKLVLSRIATTSPLREYVRRRRCTGGILDVFHFFRGGNPLEFLSQIDPVSIVAVHLDDAMDLPVHELVGYRHRVYPGQGIFDVDGFCQALFRIDYRGPYVVELFNETYWRSDPATVCTTAHETARHVLAKAACQGR